MIIRVSYLFVFSFIFYYFTLFSILSVLHVIYLMWQHCTLVYS
jgi:hypothetical protein